MSGEVLIIDAASSGAPSPEALAIVNAVRPIMKPLGKPDYVTEVRAYREALEKKLDALIEAREVIHREIADAREALGLIAKTGGSRCAAT